MTETNPNTNLEGDDVTARVLAATKELRDGFEGHYAAVASKVKKEIESPVKIIEATDGIPVVMQLSVWDTKVGPVSAMLVGPAAFLARITPQEQEASTRMMDMLAPGETCDLSKEGVNRLLLKCAIRSGAARGGESWVLLAAYYDPAIAVPKAIVEEMLKEVGASISSRPGMAAEALSIRERYDPAGSRWRGLLEELRLSIWALVQKAGEVAPAPIPGLDPAEAQALLDEEVKADTSQAKADDRPMKKAKPNPEAVKAWFYSAIAKAKLAAAERMRQPAPPKSQVAKAVAVPPVAEVVASAAPLVTDPPLALASPIHLDPTPAPISPSPVCTAPPVGPARVAPGFPAAPPQSVERVEVPPAPVPAVDTTLEKVDTTLERGNTISDTKADPLDGIGLGPVAEPVPVQITVNQPVPVTPRQPGESPASPKRLAAIEAALVQVLGKLQRSGYSLKVNKETGEATACKLVELDPGKGGLLALFLSFHARFLPHAVLHEIDGRFFAGDERFVTVPYRPATRQAVASHLKGAQDIIYRGKSIGKVYKDRPLKPVIVPVVLVRSSIRGAGGAAVPFAWVEPAPADGVEHGHLVVAAPEIDRAEAFVMNCVRVLGPRIVAAEAKHVEATEQDIKKVARSGKGAAALVSLLAGVSVLATAGAFPVDTTIAILQYWYVLAGVLVVVLVATANAYQKLDVRVGRALGARLQDVAPRTPLLVKPEWEVLVDAARRVGKADFEAFKASFCQELDPQAVDEAVEPVWLQETSRQAPSSKDAVAALGALAKAAGKTKAEPLITDMSKPSTPLGATLRVTEAGAAKRKRPAGDDILDEPEDEVAEPRAAEDGGVAIDWSAALKGK